VNERQTRSLIAFANAVAYLEKLPKPHDPELAKPLARLRKKVDLLQQAAGEQTLAGGRLVASARLELDKLRDKQMLGLADLARPHFRGEASVLAALRVPHKKATAGEILSAAEVLADTLQPHRRFLSASGIDTRRIRRLRDETLRVKKLFDAADARIPIRTLATDRIPALLTSARDDLRAINRIMLTSRSPDELVAWQIASRVGKRLGRPRKPRRRPPPSE
jgi:CHAD domain-containing protein